MCSGWPAARRDARGVRCATGAVRRTPAEPPERAPDGVSMGMMRRALPLGYPSILRGRARARFVVPSWSSLLPALAVAVAYYIPARLSLRFIVSVSGVSAIWPATGIGVAGLLLFGPEAWPGIVLGQ